tara:strand:- start:3268 stop:4593 length:1326 start_codon:yes stop_codon:yes gene_type:complete
MTLAAGMGDTPPITVKNAIPGGEAYVRAVLDGPVLVAETQVQSVVANISDLVNHEHFKELIERHNGEDDEFWQIEGYRAQYRPYNVQDGTLVIPVMGTLIHRFAYAMGNTATGYEYISKAFTRGMDDPDVKNIAFHINSPGGQAAGNFELVADITARRGEKPMMAFVDDNAMSGGYSIASAADEIVTTSAGRTGSVGVVVMHTDMSKMLDRVGINVTFIKAGERKTDGNPFEPLSETAQARIQAGVDKFYGKFVSTVANNRNMSDDAVRKTEADVFDAEESIEVGFSDRIGDFRTELASLGASNQRGISMTTKTETPAIDAATVAKDAQIAERSRFGAVMKSDHYEGRAELAQHLLANTEMDAAAIEATLAVSPKVEAAKVEPKVDGAPRDHFAERMSKEGTPGVGAEDELTGEELNAPENVSATLLSDYRKAGGRTVKRT